MSILVSVSLFALAAAVSSLSTAQGRPDPAAFIAAQREAMSVFKNIDGVWRGPAWTLKRIGDTKWPAEGAVSLK